MKELSIEELSIEDKAKRFDRAIEIARKISNGECVPALPNWTVYEVMLPELKEGEDERIRNFLISKMREVGNVWKEYSAKDIIAFLEKQGEQKPSKNIIETWKDMRLEVYQQASGNRHEPNYSDDNTKMFSLNDIDEMIERLSEKTPAEEYNITGIGAKNAQGKLGEMIKNLEPVNEVLEQNPAWSEEDNVFFKAIIRDIENVQYISEDAKKDRINWLKFLKERVQPQPKQQWSDEDKERISMLLDLVGAKEESMEVKLELVIFLKSLKNRMFPQNTWKPSDEQIEALDEVYKTHGANSTCRRVIFNLLNELKKIKGE